MITDMLLSGGSNVNADTGLAMFRVQGGWDFFVVWDADDSSENDWVIYCKNADVAEQLRKWLHNHHPQLHAASGYNVPSVTIPSKSRLLLHEHLQMSHLCDQIRYDMYGEDTDVLVIPDEE